MISGTSSPASAIKTWLSVKGEGFYHNLTNLTALQDQQLAGLIMGMPGGAVFTLLTSGYFAAGLRALERRSGERANIP